MSTKKIKKKITFFDGSTLFLLCLMLFIVCSFGWLVFNASALITKITAAILGVLYLLQVGVMLYCQKKKKALPFAAGGI